MQRPKAQQRANGTWRVQVKNKTLTADATFPSEAEAAAHIDTLMRRARKEEMTFGEFVEHEYLTSTAFLDKKPHTQSTYRTRLKRLLPFFGGMLLKDITAGKVRRYWNARNQDTTNRGGKPANDTIAIEIRLLAVIMKEAAATEYIESSPLVGVEKPEPRRRKRRVPVEERERIFRAAENPRLPAQERQAARFLAMQAEMGVRAGELAAYLVSNVNLNELLILAVDVKGRDPEPQEYRLMTDRAARYARAQMKEYPRQRYLFETLSTKTGQPRAYRYAYGLKLLRAAGIVEKDFVPHASRRELVSFMMEQGYTPEDIIAHTGHKNAASLVSYNGAKRLADAQRGRLEMMHASRAAELEERALMRFAADPSESNRRALEQCTAARQREEAPRIAALDEKFARQSGTAEDLLARIEELERELASTRGRKGRRRSQAGGGPAKPGAKPPGRVQRPGRGEPTA